MQEFHAVSDRSTWNELANPFAGWKDRETQSLRQMTPSPSRILSGTIGSKYRLLKDTCHKGLSVKLFI